MATLSDPPPAPPAPDPDAPPRIPWFAPFVVGIGIYLGLGIFVAIVAAAVGWSSLPDRFVLLATLVQDLLLIGVAVAVTSMSAPWPVWQLGVRRVRLGPGLKWAAIVFVAFFAFLIAWQQLLNIKESDDLAKQLGAQDSTFNLVAVTILVALVAPIAEELFFRGFLFGALRGAMAWVPAAVVTGIIFGVVHAGGTNAVFLVPLAVFGFLLCVLYRRTGSLLPGMGVHAFNNALALGTTLHWEAGQVLAIVIAAPVLVVAIAAAASRRWAPPSVAPSGPQPPAAPPPSSTLPPAPPQPAPAPGFAPPRPPSFGPPRASGPDGMVGGP
jgi:membrane protease YdiL (CAAX protease family)